MADLSGLGPPRPAYVVLRKVLDGEWELVAEVDRKPGLTAMDARLQAVRDALGREIAEGETYAAVLRSEWQVAQRL
jgi:hypothetical protein